jgi:hypothetical protein
MPPRVVRDGVVVQEQGNFDATAVRAETAPLAQDLAGGERTDRTAGCDNLSQQGDSVSDANQPGAQAPREAGATPWGNPYQGIERRRGKSLASGARVASAVRHVRSEEARGCAVNALAAVQSGEARKRTPACLRRGPISFRQRTPVEA